MREGYLWTLRPDTASLTVNDAVIVPFTAAIASVSGRLLNTFGEKAEVVGTEIRSSSFGVNIENGCNGVETALLFGSAVLAPGPPPESADT